MNSDKSASLLTEEACKNMDGDVSFNELAKMLEHQGFVLWNHKVTKDSVLVELARATSGRSELISVRIDKTHPEFTTIQDYIFYGYDF